MAKPLTLVGGRYDGFLFGDEGGWRPGPKVERLYLTRPDALDWERAVAAAPRGAVLTTTLAPVPYRVEGEPWAHTPGSGTVETYLRCDDGSFRIPSLARCS